jgi:shikimate 5-dehydrogenase
MSEWFASLRRGKTQELLAGLQKRKGVESSTVLQLQSENRQGSVIVNAVSVRTGCDRAIVIPTIEVGNKESVNDCVAESVILNKYRQQGTI